MWIILIFAFAFCIRPTSTCDCAGFSECLVSNVQRWQSAKDACVTHCNDTLPADLRQVFLECEPYGVDPEVAEVAKCSRRTVCTLPLPSLSLRELAVVQQECEGSVTESPTVFKTNVERCVCLITNVRSSVGSGMNVGVARSEENPNSSWLSERGGWASYLIGVSFLHILVFCLPLNWSYYWTVTNVVHNVVMYLILHTVKGAPWLTADQGASRRLTHWEQIDAGTQFTATRKFLTAVPVFLFFAGTYFTEYHEILFALNVVSLLFVLLPKLPVFHKVRIFEINKY